MRAGRKASISVIDGSQIGMSTVQVCDIPYAGVRFFNKNAVANIIAWFKCIKLGMDPNYFKECQTFVLYTRDTSPVELPKHFLCVHDVMTVSTVAQNMAKYTEREVQAATLAKPLRELMGLMPSRDA